MCGKCGVLQIQISRLREQTQADSDAMHRMKECFDEALARCDTCSYKEQAAGQEIG